MVVTTIAAPNQVLRQLATDCAERGLAFIVVGDTKSPADFSLEQCDYHSVEAQQALPWRFARACPTRHYARKNIGYLLAIAGGAEFIAETDDDNLPGPAFYEPLPLDADLPVLEGEGWVNLYRYYTDGLIWPRGLPLDAISRALPTLPAPRPVRIPIQQGLADENPDVDAIFRLTLPLPFSFERGGRLAIGSGSWCPYNSQNTIHYREAFPLLYLPAHCSFRMTDIWRSFVAQRIAWTCGWGIAFREATVVQDRNDHDLMRDFEDEISGYLGNRKIAAALEELPLRQGREHIGDNLRACYARLIADGHVGAEEEALVDAWLTDLASLGAL